MSTIKDENVPHEDAQAKATDAQLARTSNEGPIADIPEVTDIYLAVDQIASAVNKILGVLRDAELIPKT